MKIYFVPKDDRGCGFYRMMLPASKLKDAGLAEVELDLFKLNEQKARWADVIILQRPDEPELYEIIPKLQAMGKFIVIDFDDLLWSVNPRNPAYTYWSPIGGYLTTVLNIVKMANAVTVTTKRLASEYAQFNRKIHVLPNYLDKDQWDLPQGWTSDVWDAYYHKKYDETIRIGWSGGASHQDDLEMVSNIIEKLCQNNPNVQFILMGFNPKDIFGKINLGVNKCPHCGQDGQLVFEKGVSLLEYPSKLKYLAFDIAIAPLVENGFNECKSDLKLKEYAALGIPTVASDISPYSNSLKDGVTGFLAKSGKQWYNRLEILVKDKSLREKMGKAARQWYKENTIDKHINKWIETYQNIINILYEW